MSAIPDQSSSTQPLHVSCSVPQVSFSPDERDRFIKEAQRAFLANQNELAFERFLRQFTDEFLPPIHGWCKEHDDRVEACYVAFAKDHLRVFVVRRSNRYDFTLTDDLSDLEMDLFEKHWPCEILQVPSGYLSSFFDPAASMQVYANGG